MNTVVERCPNCGVEHEPSHVGPCEVCGSELRNWCTRHSRTIGWLEGPGCPVCARETAERAAAPPPPPPVPRRATLESHPAARSADPPPRIDPRDVLPHVATGASVAIRVVHALLVLARTVFFWAILAGLAGAVYGYLTGSDLIWVALFGLSNGALLGLFFGILRALRILFARRARR